MHIRKLANGRYQCSVRHPSGKRYSKTHDLKGHVEKWGREQEAKFAAGDFRDPRAGRITVGEWHETWWPGLVLEWRTLELYESRLRLYILPHWATWPLEAIKPSDVQKWVRKLVDSGVGARTVQQSHMVFALLLERAVLDDKLKTNPARGVDLPKSAAPNDRAFTHAEVAAIIAALRLPRDRVLVDLACYAGLRWGELSGLRVDRIDFRLSTLHVTHVWDGKQLREYPKSRKSRRPVPIPEHSLASVAEACAGKSGAELAFVSRTGRPLDRHSWRASIWVPALGRAEVDYSKFHSCRHTAASWLVMAGVDLYRVQALLGHESFATSQRYAHLQPDYHTAITDAWGVMRAVENPADASLPLLGECAESDEL